MARKDLGEHPADYASNKILPQLMSDWGSGYPVQQLVNAMPGAARGTQMGNLQQSVQGQQVGGQSNGGQGATPFGSPQMNQPAMPNLTPQ